MWVIGSQHAPHLTSSLSMPMPPRQLFHLPITGRHHLYRSATAVKMAVPAASRVFGIVELAVQILDEASSGDDGMRILYALQRVSTGLRGIIQNTPQFKIKMGLQHESAGSNWHATGVPQHSQAIKALKHDLSFAPFYANNNSVPGAGTPSNSADSPLRREYDALWMFEVASVEWAKSIGVCGTQIIHCSPEASWRKIRLFARSATLTIIVAVRIGGESGEVLARPALCHFESAEEAYLRGWWRRSGMPRYTERISFTSDQATLGNVADALETILQRSEGMHRKLSETRRVARSFGEPGPAELEGNEGEIIANLQGPQGSKKWSGGELNGKSGKTELEGYGAETVAEISGWKSWLNQSDHKPTGAMTVNLSEELQLAIALLMSMEKDSEAEEEVEGVRQDLEASMNATDS